MEHKPEHIKQQAVAIRHTSSEIGLAQAGKFRALAAARSSIAEYIRTAERTSYNYGSFCGAVDWLAAAEGLIQLQEA